MAWFSPFATRIASLVAVFTLHAFAHASAEQPLTYQPLNHRENSEFAAEFDNVLKASGYKTLELPGEPKFDTPALWLNRLYAGKANGRVYAKAGVATLGKFEYGKVYAIPGQGFVTHLPDFERGDHVFFFDGLSREASESMAKSLLDAAVKMNTATGARGATLQQRRLRLFARLAMNSANADDEVTTNHLCRAEAPSAELQRQADATTFQIAGKCGLGLIKGIWDATGGLVQFGVDVAVGAGRLALSGAHYAVHWNEIIPAMQKTRENVARFFANLNDTMKDALEGFQNLPIDEQAEFYCELGSTIGTGVMVSYITAGASAGLLLPKISQVVKTKKLAGKTLAEHFPKQARNLEARAIMAQRNLITEGKAASAKSTYNDALMARNSAIKEVKDLEAKLATAERAEQNWVFDQLNLGSKIENARAVRIGSMTEYFDYAAQRQNLLQSFRQDFQFAENELQEIARLEKAYQKIWRKRLTGSAGNTARNFEIEESFRALDSDFEKILARASTLKATDLKAPKDLGKWPEGAAEEVAKVKADLDKANLKWSDLDKKLFDSKDKYKEVQPTLKRVSRRNNAAIAATMTPPFLSLECEYMRKGTANLPKSKTPPHPSADAGTKQ